MRTSNLIAAWALLTSVHPADGAEILPPCDLMPAAQLTASEPRSHGRNDLYWTGDIVVSVTIAADGAIRDAQARINEGVPARFYRFGYAQPIGSWNVTVTRHPSPKDSSVVPIGTSFKP